MIGFITDNVWNWWTGGSSSQGKTNNHVTHNAGKNYMLTYYKKLGKVFKKVILWTDNCAAKYKCKQAILDLTTHSKRYQNTSSTHCFATLYNFKGAWDSAGKIPKKLFINWSSKESVALHTRNASSTPGKF